MAWNDLSIAQRSQLINTFRHNGVSSLSEMKRLYDLYSPLEGNVDTYNTPVAPVYAGGGKKRTYKDWAKNIEKQRGITVDDPDYDYKGFYNENPERAWKMLQESPDAHFTDRYKTLSHPTLSNESVYANGLGGTWGNGTFELSEYLMKNSDRTVNYLKQNDPNIIPIYKNGIVLNSSKVVANTSDTYAGGGDKGTLNNKRYNSEHERAMYDYLRSGGLNHQQASGLLGNLAVESYLDAEMQQIGGPAYGLMQAEGARKRAMLSYNDKPYLFGSGLSQEEQQQLDYILDKGIDTYTPGEWGKKGFSGARKAREAFISSSDTREASDIITNNFLRPGKPNLSRRRAMSEYYDDKYSNTAPYNMENWYDGQTAYSDGGSKIHIKPSHRGKFTALKKRTGHSASWFKAHGTPAQRKMATFELNARHWKHSHGGIKF